MKYIYIASMLFHPLWRNNRINTCIKSEHAPFPRTTATGDGILKTFKTGRACTRNGESSSPYELFQVHEFAGLFLKTFEKLATIAGKFSYPQESRREFFYGNFVFLFLLYIFQRLRGRPLTLRKVGGRFFTGNLLFLFLIYIFDPLVRQHQCIDVQNVLWYSG